MPRELTKAIPAILLLPVLLSGCQQVFKAIIRNESSEPIAILQSTNALSREAATGEKTKGFIGQWHCVRIQVGRTTRYFSMGSGTDLPEDVVDTGMFSTRVSMLYSDDGLYFVSQAERRIAMTELEQCEP